MSRHCWLRFKAHDWRSAWSGVPVHGRWLFTGCAYCERCGMYR